MKTNSLLFTALFVVATAITAMGKDEPRKTGMAIVPVKGSEIFKVVYKGESQGRVKLNVYDAYGSLILAQMFTATDGFICPLNFRGLSSGNYTIEVVDASGRKKEVISLAREKERKEASKKNVHVSRLEGGNKFLLSVVGVSGTGERVNIAIYDQKNNLIYTESKKANGDFAQVYDVQRESESYTFEISDRSGKIRTVRF